MIREGLLMKSMIKSKVPVIMMSLAMAFTMVALSGVTAFAAESTPDIVGGKYQIRTYDDLKAFAEIVNKGRTDANAVLVKDIKTMGDTEWIPIGSNAARYCGTFDGYGNTITGISNKDSGSEQNYQGLFGYLGKDALVQNVRLEETDINGMADIGGVAGNNFGTILNCYSAGSVKGTETIGGIAGRNNGKILNCFNAGNINGTKSVGGVAAYNYSAIKNCGNAGAIEGTEMIGGVAAQNTGIDGNEIIANCYNIGAIRGTKQIGGLLAGNLRATMTNCYNAGEIINTGDGYVGGVLGHDIEGTISNCYYDKQVCTIEGAIGNGSVSNDTATVKGLETAQMTGESAIGADNMAFVYPGPDGGRNPWLTKAPGDSDGKYYWYYPHLIGFNVDGVGYQTPASDIQPKDWPPKVTEDIRWIESTSNKYIYNGSAQGPRVEGVTVLSASGSVLGTLRPDEDYTVSYYACAENGDPDSSEIQPGKVINAGRYLAVVMFAGGYAVEKEFEILPAKLTITAIDQSFVYNGNKQGPGDKAYNDPAEIARVVRVKGLQNGDKLEGIQVDGQGQRIGRYVLEPSGALINNDPAAKNNYSIEYVNGTLTITPIPLSVSVTGSGTNRTYNGKAQTYEGTVTVTSADPAFDASKFHYTGSTVVKGTRAGEYTAPIKAAACAYDDQIYELKVKTGAPVKLRIGKAKITIKADDKRSVRGKKLKKLTYTVSGGYVKGDKLGVTLTTNANRKKAGTYRIKTGWNRNPDYEAALINGRYKVTAPPAPKVSGTLMARMTASGKQRLELSWRQIKGAKGYDVFFIKCGKNQPRLVQTIDDNETLTWSKAGLKAKTPYKAFVKAYVIKNGKKTYVRTSPLLHAYTSGYTKNYTNPGSVTLKKTRVSLGSGGTYRIKASVTKLKKGKKLMPEYHGASLRYRSSNTKVATVSSTGKITAGAKGSCKVYVYAINGIYKTVNVTVK